MSASSRPDHDQGVAAFGALVNGQVERDELDRGDRTLRWLAGGVGGPTVVLEAGAMSPVASFAAIFQRLVTEHRVIAYDRAGYGASDPAPLSLDLQFHDLLAILEAVGPQPSIVVGHSWGGLLAQLAAWERPELIAGLVLVDPSHERVWLEYGSPDERLEMSRHPDVTISPSEDPRSEELKLDARQLAVDVARSVDAKESVRDLLLETCLSYLQTEEQLFVHLDEFPMIMDHAEEIAVRRPEATWAAMPVVLLTATKGRPGDITAIVTEAQDEVIAAAGGQHIIVPDSGHYIQVDRPDLVVQAIRDVALAATRAD